MIGSVSSYSPYTSTSSTATSSARSQQFQKELLSKLDSNADGSVDQEELSTALSQKSDDGILVSLSDNFSDLDSDSSGDLSSDEIAAMAPPPPPPRDQAPTTELADALLSALDADGDGEVSSEELSNGLASAGSTADSQELFSALDENEDGTVSLDELAASLPPPPPQQASSEALFSQLDADGQSNTGTSELTSAVQANRTSDSSTDQTNVSEALNRMIANLSRQYSLDDVAPVGKYLNVAT
ncbi:EF-hand domain-containing protein [Pseudomonas sp. Fig-3]|jgi:Ca2+-binding EF-hand superfamily protein|uniref:EF-hand domain-containing protein n=1 Tax=unclassified Pseudomonas TaxID=196821 RepID=UPI0010F1FAAD|nr:MULTISPECIES: EF-hand domain-containing protein [unclassified Pseudomonas]MDD2033713.1 EF-hand domain-containing protein [Pseudomonas sp. 39167]MEA1028796.1 EF-hand domain-containing protein [Pseudomonas sp. N-137]MXR31220.1 histidine kinase [Pseudomonas sp. PICF6]QKJ34950.1 EF-hand domain-containing protein [Pseudomonas sp. MPDS]TNB85091.1 EF-hand domain-containing protein [Pseudomonas sp. Fig-3]